METVGLAEVAAVLAEPSRAAMCLALLDGRAWTVGELAKAAGVRPSTASEHVARLRETGFVSGAKQGRHNYVRIADPRVADLIEHLAQHAEHRPARGLKESLRVQRLAFARTCYDHLAGTLGVAIRDGMVRTGIVDVAAGLTLTGHGREVLVDLGVAVPSHGRRPLLRDCLDWTERRDHFGGALPAALLEHAVGAGWLRREPRRAVRLLAAEPFRGLGVAPDSLVQSGVA
ncbi:metalloregulator ArsR/SmtB family transcription factor [Amycolatopsis acidiphila]|uniref:Winged helix-turn-helix transcriptional regulator n=1 Tax=Amycolatopsis acidiphila TaxID=715473 RepID=A0A558ABH8_9PSEU|nr:metalloregulator ArsR/SmtB family transcription factor [Amycolatopsis acidiphila]TVT21585.1 winged helix-turn-helix transcriptional regulator [Amycolatopsis acidiphila]UIJ62165.1 metalloregulator ArsR/SmtB family transcription factor [Amycolatopsis acidiphila]GHG92210.1 transcriptional regulator [Amycolatopsis acidiphila]